MLCRSCPMYGKFLTSGWEVPEDDIFSVKNGPITEEEKSYFLERPTEEVRVLSRLLGFSLGVEEEPLDDKTRMAMFFAIEEYTEDFARGLGFEDGRIPVRILMLIADEVPCTNDLLSGILSSNNGGEKNDDSMFDHLSEILDGILEKVKANLNEDISKEEAEEMATSLKKGILEKLERSGGRNRTTEVHVILGIPKKKKKTDSSVDELVSILMRDIESRRQEEVSK